MALNWLEEQMYMCLKDCVKWPDWALKEAGTSRGKVKENLKRLKRKGKMETTYTRRT